MNSSGGVTGFLSSLGSKVSNAAGAVSNAVVGKKANAAAIQQAALPQAALPQAGGDFVRVGGRRRRRRQGSRKSSRRNRKTQRRNRH